MKLEVVEALFSIGRLYREKLPALAADLLESGVDTPALRILAGLIGVDLDAANEYFTRALSELGRAPLSREEAARHLAVDLAQAVLSGKISKREAARTGAEYANMLDYHETFMPLYSADDNYECLCHSSLEADGDVAAWAKATLEEEGGQAA